jgi:hypothetical protein
MLQAFAQNILLLLSAEVEREHGSLARLLRDAAPSDVRQWPDGSVHFSLEHSERLVPLSSPERVCATGTHAGLPFDLQLRGRTEALLGVLWFSADGHVPRRVEVNTVSDQQFDACSVVEGDLTLAVTPPGASPP